MLQHHPHGFFGGVPIAAAEIVERKSHGGYAEQIGFGGGGHGAGIKCVVAHIGAVVHTGEHQIGLEIGQRVQAQMNAVGGGAAHIIKAVFGLADMQRAVERERIAHAAAVALRRHHAHIGKLTGHPRQHGNAFSQIAIIVTNQNIHHFPFRRPILPIMAGYCLFHRFYRSGRLKNQNKKAPPKRCFGFSDGL